MIYMMRCIPDNLVQVMRFELTRCYSLASETNAYTISATPAYAYFSTQKRYIQPIKYILLTILEKYFKIHLMKEGIKMTESQIDTIPDLPGTAPSEKTLKRSRVLYIIEAALEYLISILVADSYLATLTSEIGMSDSLTGIISSFISLGCIFQLLSILFRKRNVKLFVLILSITDQLLFLFLYVIPLFDLSVVAKTTIFIVCIFVSYFVYNIAHPKKIGWLMSMVHEDKRGVFTAKKEIISLISGMGFTFMAGSIIDYYKERGEVKTAFIIMAVTIFFLMVFHSLTLAFTSKRGINEQVSSTKFTLNTVKTLFKDKRVAKLAVLFMLWYIAMYSTIPFYGTYKIHELGFSMKFVSILSIIYAVSRASVSIFWGKFADRYSFAKMIRICFLIAAAGFGVNAFTVPENGKILFTIYIVLNAVAMAGINSSLINLCFDYIEFEKRSDVLALCQASSGVIGFISTLIMSFFVDRIQTNGGITIFGKTLYAQQFTSIVACIMTLVTITFLIIAFRNMKRINR